MLGRRGFFGKVAGAIGAIVTLGSAKADPNKGARLLTYGVDCSPLSFADHIQTTGRPGVTFTSDKIDYGVAEYTEFVMCALDTPSTVKTEDAVGWHTALTWITSDLMVSPEERFMAEVAKQKLIWVKGNGIFREFIDKA